MRRFLLVLLCLAPLALPALASSARAQAVAAPLTAADQQALARIGAYLNSITTLKAHFVQDAADGQVSEGTAWLERPGRMRFQYSPPSPLLLVAGHGLVVFHDASVDQTSNIPIGTTPLGLLLDAHIALSGPVTVTAFAQPPGRDVVTLVRTAAPGEGSLTLDFNADPLALTQWTVLDAQGRQTTVHLFDVALGGHFDQSLFSYVDPRMLGTGNGMGGD